MHYTISAGGIEVGSVDLAFEADVAAHAFQRRVWIAERRVRA